MSETCPPGSYKMSSRQQECFPCPENSVAEEDGSIVCVCKEDHFRTPLDTPSAPCTMFGLRAVRSCPDGADLDQSPPFEKSVIKLLIKPLCSPFSHSLACFTCTLPHLSPLTRIKALRPQISQSKEQSSLHLSFTPHIIIIIITVHL
ncbi:hypothetical protein WMY93_020108 [Mugilogobius chulae]|uniref:Tyrosine-protein kinase ephrin type A/B receptor-like domain-containing protein n=1 Tax=Mugilogobius chulae TaxID=88201 RepID=A0AAW0NL32_9GOBI